MNNSYNSGVSFGSSFDIKGTWEDKTTGEVIVAKGTVFEDNQMIIMTTDGRRINYDKFQNFVQVSEKALTPRPPRPKNNPKPQTGNQTNKLFDVDDAMKAEMDSLFSNNQENSILNSVIHTDVPLWGEGPTISQITPTPHPTLITNNNINPVILTSLDNLPEEEQPKITVSIEWEDKSVLDFLYKYMNITPDEITEALIYKYCNIDNIKDVISKELDIILSDPLKEELISKPKISRGRPKKKD